MSIVNEQTKYDLATADVYINGLWYEDRVLEFPNIRETANSDFGIYFVSDVTVSLDNSDGAFTSRIDYIRGTVIRIRMQYPKAEVVPEEILVYEREMLVRAVTISDGVVTLTLGDLLPETLDRQYPSLKWTASRFSTIHEDHAGNDTPMPVGLAKKLNCVLVSADDDAGIYVIGVCGIDGLVKPFTDEKVLAIYYDDVLVGTTDATDKLDTTLIDLDGVATGSYRTQDFGGISYLMADMVKAPIGGSRQVQRITADVLIEDISIYNAGTLNARNAARYLQVVMNRAGMTPDATSFAAAETWCDDNKIGIDPAMRAPITYRSMIQKLLHVLRGSIYRLGNGDWAIWQDKASTEVDRFQEQVGDPVFISAVTFPAIPNEIGLRYRDDGDGKLEFEIAREIPQSTEFGGQIEDFDIISNQETADRMLSYLVDRRRYQTMAAARVVGRDYKPGDLISVSDTSKYPGLRSWFIVGMNRNFQQGVVELELVEYNEWRFRYNPGQIPAEATVRYQPDISVTAPGPVSSLLVFDERDEPAAENYVTLSVRCTPPAQKNWVKIKMMTQKIRTDGSFGPTQVQEAVESTTVAGTYEAVFGNIQQGEFDYKISGWAENENGVASKIITSITYETIPI